MTSVAFRPDGAVVLTGDEGGFGQLRDAASGRPLGEPLRHEDPVRIVRFRPDAKVALTVAGKVARLWDADTGRPLGGPLGHEAGITSVAFSPDSKAVLTGGEDGVARQWDAANGRPLGGPMPPPE